MEPEPDVPEPPEPDVEPLPPVVPAPSTSSRMSAVSFDLTGSKGRGLFSSATEPLAPGTALLIFRLNV